MIRSDGTTSGIPDNEERLIFYGILLGIVCVFIGYRLLGGVTYVNYCRIGIGDSAEDVEGLLRIDGPGSRYGEPIRFPNQGAVEYWHGYDGTILVFYDLDNRVIGKEWDGNARKRCSLDMLIDHLRGRGWSIRMS
jgi:hypothetical protein